jgi:hypothetical protein
MTPTKNHYLYYAMQIAAATLVGICCLQPVSAAQTADDAEAAARDNWRATMAQNSEMGEGCFRASYPSIVWEQVECKELRPRVHPIVRSLAGGQVTGDGHDYVASTTGLISKTLGTFPTVTGVKTEKSVGVQSFGGGGILGPNEYSLQLNTNFTGTTSACKGHTGCVVWQQFIYATDYATEGEAAVFMQYWLIGWGSSACPSGFGSDGGGDCFGNSKSVAAPDVKATSLSKLSISAAAGTNDTVVFTDGTTAYSVSASDKVLDISQVWKQSEFNIVGDAGGSRADFNTTGVSITVKVALTDGSTSAPTCVANDGTTGESNNLNLSAKCTTASGTSPSIQFTESN